VSITLAGTFSIFILYSWTFMPIKTKLCYFFPEVKFQFLYKRVSVISRISLAKKLLDIFLDIYSDG
jgi:hypothetical protein